MMFVPSYVQPYILWNQFLHLVVFCFPLFYICMDFLFNLGQHCEGRQGIDFCLRGLTGTSISLYSWGFTAGCDNAQNIPSNLSANLLPNQADLKNHLMTPTSGGQSRTYFSIERMPMEKNLIVKQKYDTQVWLSMEAVGGSFLVMLGCSIPDTHRSGCWQAEVVCCFKSGDNCSLPRISKMTSTVNLALQFLTQECILYSFGWETKWEPNVRESRELEHIMQNSKTLWRVLWVEKQKVL